MLRNMFDLINFGFTITTFDKDELIANYFKNTDNKEQAMHLNVNKLFPSEKFCS